MIGPPGRTLAIESCGNAVRLWQRWLDEAAKRSGGVFVVVDGQFGPATSAATRAFQARAGLIVDGLVGTESWIRMQELLR